LKKYIILIFTAIILITSAGFLYNYFHPKLLIGNKSDLINIEIVTYVKNNTNKNVVIKKEDFYKLYDAISKTKIINIYRNPREYETMECDSKYTLYFNYSNGDKDVFYTTPSGKFIFKYFNDSAWESGWFGGDNNLLNNIIDMIIKESYIN
jgi:phage pi2 protein 07